MDKPRKKPKRPRRKPQPDPNEAAKRMIDEIIAATESESEQSDPSPRGKRNGSGDDRDAETGGG